MKPGADGPVSFSFVTGEAAEAALETLTELGLSSQSDALSYRIVGNALEAYVAGGEGGAERVVFSLTVQPGGSFEFKLFDQLDHDAPGDDALAYRHNTPQSDENFDLQDDLGRVDVTDINFGALIKATDGDGDSVTLDDVFSIRIRDDVPEVDARATGGRLVVDETAGSDAGDDETSSEAVTALFSGVGLPGNDPDMTRQYATQTGMVTAVVKEGADDTASVTWALKLVGGNGTYSGLQTTDGRDIYLFIENGLVVGRYDKPNDGDSDIRQPGQADPDPAAFAIHISNDGTLSMVQYVSIKHDDPKDSDESNDASDGDRRTSEETLANKIFAEVTVEDFDGDKATDTVEIGSKIVFEDDGPRIDIIATNEGDVVLTTQDGETIGSATDYSSSSASFGGVFSIASQSFGADGAGRVSMGYALSLAGNNGMDSGLNHDGRDINLFLIDGVVYGKTHNGELVFTISVNGNGEVTLAQFREIDHSRSDSNGPYTSDIKELANNLVKLTATATITDGDGDRAVDSETIDLGGNIRFQDDGPSINLVARNEQNVVLQTQDGETIGYGVTDYSSSCARFDGVFSIASQSFGADGPGRVSMSYALSLTGNNGMDSGLNHDGRDIKLFLIDGVVYGKTHNGELVFTISVNGDGEVTLAQFREIDHSRSDSNGPYTSDIKELANNLVKLTATATIFDEEGDRASDSETIDLGGNIRFQDDGPRVNLVARDEHKVVLQTQDGETIGYGVTDYSSSSARFDGVFSISSSSSFGADGAGRVSISYALGLAGNNGMDSGLNHDGRDIKLFLIDGVVYGKTQNGEVVFTISVNGDGEVTLAQFREIDHSRSDSNGPYT
ncbi:MAG: DUF5801 repeats-in-toxin domain-containing protein, partial [Pseudomonadota bacterium]|nr:DUF5801 repeats-in-toxin domain-containing protein [Pseudomonadota bacterium]